MAIGGREEKDLPPKEMYLHQGTETPPKHNASTAGKRDAMHATALRKDFNPAMKDLTNKPTLLTWRRRKNKTMR